MKSAKPVAKTGAATAKTVPDTPLSSEEHSAYRTAVGKLLWLALAGHCICDKGAESGCDCPDNAECRKVQTPTEIPD